MAFINYFTLGQLVIVLMNLHEMVDGTIHEEMSLRNRKGNKCVLTTNEPGRYRLSGLAKRPWHQPYCSVYIRSPPHTKIRFTFQIDHLDCKNSILKVYDGWHVFDWFKKKHYSLPEVQAADKGSARERDLCSEDNIANDMIIETSQNAGQIIYLLDRRDAIDFTIDFVQEEKACSVFISDTMDGLYKISNRGKSGICTWYISSAVVVTLMDIQLLNTDTETCGDASENYLKIRSSGLSWRLPDMKLEQAFCKNETVRLEHLLPCKFNRIELHTNDTHQGQEQFVTFALRQASEIEKEPFTYYCY